MRRIAVINQKGGVGKTTTTVNLAAALALAGKRVCVLDLDPQAHATTHLGVEPDGKHPSMYDVLVSSRPLAEARREVSPNLWVAGSDIDLAAAEVELAGVVGREVILRDQMAQDPEAFDFTFMDCGPSLGVLTLNALAAANEVFIPLQPHYLALHGMSKLLETTALVARRINPGLKVTGVILTLQEPNARLAREVAENLRDFLGRARGGATPWANARLFDTRIRRNIKLAECPSFGKSIFDHAPSSHGADDYAALAREVLGEPPTTITAARVTLAEPVAGRLAPHLGAEAPGPLPVSKQPMEAEASI
jgi:chromosome partitioning protein